jgi:hypothetical protein
MLKRRGGLIMLIGVSAAIVAAIGAVISIYLILTDNDGKGS